MVPKKNFIFKVWKERKSNQYREEVLNPTVQQIVINLYTKYEPFKYRGVLLIWITKGQVATVLAEGVCMWRGVWGGVNK